MIRIALALALALACACNCLADDIKVIAGSAIQPVITKLLPGFERETGHRVTFHWGAVGEMAKRASAGEVADVVVVSEPQFDALAKERHVVRESKRVIGKTGVGLFVRKGDPHPDIGSVESFKATMLAAKSIGFNDPAAGAPVSIYLLGLFDRLGISEAMAPKTVAFKKRTDRFDAVARGDVQLGFNQVSEIVAVPSVELVGELPAAIQNYTVFTAGVLSAAPNPRAARQLLDFMGSADTIAAFRKGGFSER